VVGECGARPPRLLRRAGNTDAVAAFRTEVTMQWFKTLRRRSQRNRLNWARMNRLATQWLPPVRVIHPFPSVRFSATTQGRSPSAVVPHAGICAGGRSKERSLPRSYIALLTQNQDAFSSACPTNGRQAQLSRKWGPFHSLLLL